jgi:hypothetical protein
MSSLMIPKMFAAEFFGGVVAPARTLENVISQLIAWFSAAMQSQIEKKFAALSFFAGGSAASILAPKQYDDYGRIIRDASLTRE